MEQHDEETVSNGKTEHMENGASTDSPVHIPAQSIDVEQINAEMSPSGHLVAVEEDEETTPSESLIDDDFLGTPTGNLSGDEFDGMSEFASHRFVGPSSNSDDSSMRCLHGIRHVSIHCKPPKFVSEPSSQITPQQRNSLLNTDMRVSFVRSQSTPLAVIQPQPNVFSVTFAEDVLGFRTDVVISGNDELTVQVHEVDSNSPASRAGVIVGDSLVSVNGQAIEPHMTEEQVVEMISQASKPRTMLFSRPCEELMTGQSRSVTEEPQHPTDTGGGTSTRTGTGIGTGTRSYLAKGLAIDKKKAGRAMFGKLSSAKKYLGNAFTRKKQVVHADHFCDGCGMNPIRGALFTCSVCTDFNLCQQCYDGGIHGKENSEDMQLLQEAIVQEKLLKKCKHFTPEFLLSLRRDICKGRIDKFEYMGGWIGDIVGTTAASKITVRGIEIPLLTPAARQRFVSFLMPLVSNRTDIEVHIEWLPDETAKCPEHEVHEEEDEEEGEGAVENGRHKSELEKLRIWISDKKTRTASPFVEEFTETEN